jgi:predicted 3-demethylubiquinone-9 3-methyltransferase (glyoxalase superfamily)
MSNAETPTMRSEVRLMVMVIWRQFTLMGAFLQCFAVARRFEGDFCTAFSRIVATESQNELGQGCRLILALHLSKPTKVS